MAPGLNDRERQPWKTGPRADVEYGITLEQGLHRKAVGEVQDLHLLAVADRRQVDLPIPALQLIEQPVECYLDLFCMTRQSARPRSVADEAVDARSPTHVRPPIQIPVGGQTNLAKQLERLRARSKIS
jgi:hypothetical protein